VCTSSPSGAHRRDREPRAVQAVALAVQPPHAVRPPCGQLVQPLQLRRGAQARAHGALAAGRDLSKMCNIETVRSGCHGSSKRVHHKELCKFGRHMSGCLPEAQQQ
jgi:hypothetical protein